jgi:hypothetical protein
MDGVYNNFAESQKSFSVGFLQYFNEKVNTHHIKSNREEFFPLRL